MTTAPRPGVHPATRLFTKGAASVRIRCTQDASGAIRVEVHGPGDAATTHICPTLEGCVEIQEQLDAKLRAEGYTAHPLPDRRRSAERRRRTRGARRRRRD